MSYMSVRYDGGGSSAQTLVGALENRLLPAKLSPGPLRAVDRPGCRSPRRVSPGVAIGRGSPIGSHGQVVRSSGRVMAKCDHANGRKREEPQPGASSRARAQLRGIRPMAKSTSRRAVSAPARIKTAVVISPEAFRRLGAACLAENM